MEAATPERGNGDRVDLVAKGRSGKHIAIELKIVEARRTDYTQLTSCRGNLESSRVPADKVRGTLVAPSFSRKVLSSAAIEPRITLLRFGKVTQGGGGWIGAVRNFLGRLAHLRIPRACGHQ